MLGPCHFHSPLAPFTRPCIAPRSPTDQDWRKGVLKFAITAASTFIAARHHRRASHNPSPPPHVDASTSSPPPSHADAFTFHLFIFTRDIDAYQTCPPPHSHPSTPGWRLSQCRTVKGTVHPFNSESKLKSKEKPMTLRMRGITGYGRNKPAMILISRIY